MIIDKLMELSDDQALTATAASTNTVDFGATRDIAPGEPMYLVVTSKAAPGGTSPTIAISIETDDNTGFSSATTLVSSGTLAAAAFGLGTRIVIPVPHGCERYVRGKFTLGGTSPTFTVDAHLTNQQPPYHRAYPNAI